MAKVFPFKAIRPVANKVHLITTRSYISYTKAQLKIKLASNPFSFIHVLNPELVSEEVSLKEKFKQVGRSFKVFLGKKYFVEESLPSLYVYRQEHQGKSFTGIVSLVSINDYKNAIIKKHELTIEHREEMFKDYLNETQIHAEPVLLTYRSNKEIKNIINNTVKNKDHIYDFVTHDEVLHTLWKIDRTSEIKLIQDAFSSIDSLYIADGHHRSASSLRLYEDLKSDKYDKFLSFLLSDDELSIKGYHRIINLDELSKNDFMSAMKSHYKLTEVYREFVHSNHGEHLYIDGKWYKILPNQKTDLLPVEYFTTNIVNDVLTINDIRSSNRIKYIDSSCTAQEFESKVKSNSVGIVLPPLTTNELMEVSDKGKTLPPKSTWIEPKLRSALLIYRYENDKH